MQSVIKKDFLNFVFTKNPENDGHSFHKKSFNTNNNKKHY